jgi:RND family efflux transporter MFP subunit
MRIQIWNVSRSRVSRSAVAWIGLSLLPLAAGCGGHSGRPKGAEAAATISRVVVVAPTYRDLTRKIVQPGYLRPYEQTPVYTKIAGFVESVNVDIGDKVKKDQLLVKLSVPEVVEDLNVRQARVQQAEADLVQAGETVRASRATRESSRAKIQEAEAGIARADSDVKRWQIESERGSKLIGRGVYDQQTLDEMHNQLASSQAAQNEARAKHASASATFDESSARLSKAEADVLVARARLAVAKAEYAQWKAWLHYSELRAPFDGVVTLRNVHTGHFLQPSNSGSTSKASDPLFTLMRSDIMRLTVQVPELDAALVKEGDKAAVRLQALPGKEVVGTVTRFSWSLDDKARTLRVEIHLKNPKGELRPGMYANVTIFTKVPNALTLPPAAILSDILANKDRSYCLIVENGKARKTLVEIGVRGEEGIQVLRKQVPGEKWEDFSGTEAVVVSNPGALLDGQPVEIRPAEEN